jgi:hypothetical protein
LRSQVFVIARSVLKIVSHFGLKWRRWKKKKKKKKKKKPGEYICELCEFAGVGVDEQAGVEEDCVLERSGDF